MELLRFLAPPVPAHHWNRHPAPMIQQVPSQAAWASVFTSSGFHMNSLFKGLFKNIMRHHVYKNESGINIFVVS